MIKWKYSTATGAALFLSGTLTAWANTPNSSMLGSPSDARITADVMEVIAQHRDLGAPNQIYVNTHGDVVYQSGRVIPGLIEDNGEKLARKVPGVTRVVTTIGVVK